ncbi:hypothetical protein [Actinoplanes sp. GCM10030250]|uniref:hypothetical protein n=1 Tax=Actinoplanes sp. GCM10030250 TaxID=3273376 RepID=UPI00360CE463
MALRFGFRPTSSRVGTCPRYAAGKRCRIYFRPEERCGWHCDWFDHSFKWIASDGTRIFSTEPYSIQVPDPNHAAEQLLERVEPLGVSVTVIGRERSVWVPGNTVLFLAHPLGFTVVDHIGFGA